MSAKYSRAVRLVVVAAAFAPRVSLSASDAELRLFAPDSAEPLEEFGSLDLAPASNDGELIALPSVVDDVGNEVDTAVSPAASPISLDGDGRRPVAFGDWLGYRSEEGDTTWLVGGGFEMFSLESYPALQIDEDGALKIGTGFHFLSGPVAPDMPPRLFDFQLGYRARKKFGDATVFDLKLGVGAFSDFEASARKGIRYPGHAVVYHAWRPHFVSVFGVDYLDRDDISLLPVAGMVWRPVDDVICEFVFPRPKLQVELASGRAMYVAGELGGGTWAIERADLTPDNATYRDLRVVFGIAKFGDRSSVLEIGWAFDRSLRYRSGDRFRPGDALVLRCRAHY
ncbi:MAG: hypothetical protein AAF961_12970 [Planctomycetota bacterium]